MDPQGLCSLPHQGIPSLLLLSRQGLPKSTRLTTPELTPTTSMPPGHTSPGDVLHYFCHNWGLDLATWAPALSSCFPSMVNV